MNFVFLLKVGELTALLETGEGDDLSTLAELPRLTVTAVSVLDCQ